MDRKKRNDIILITIIVIAAALLLCARSGLLEKFGIAGSEQSSDVSVVITVDNREVYRESADKLVLPAEIAIDGYSGGHNRFLIDKDDSGNIELSCIEADCPDKICVETGEVTTPDQPIVCLPHRVTARIIKSS